jgi:glycosyltransferase involved in cell wall biosynthesis
MPDFVILANARWNTQQRGGNSSQQYAQAIMQRGWRLSYIQKDQAVIWAPLEQLPMGPETVVMCDMPWVDFYYDIFMDLKQKGCRTVYRIVDNWLLTPRRSEYQQAREIEFIRAADVVFASNPLNIERFQHLRSDISLLRNGVDLQAFWNWEGECPPDLIFGRPTAAFVASFWDPTWVDWEALLLAAAALPELSLNIFGDASALPAADLPGNLHLLGRRPWTSLPAYLHYCEVGVLAYAAERTRYTNPLKALEYLGCGLPVVACPNPSLTDFPYVYFYTKPSELPERISQAAAIKPDPEFLYETLTRHTWQVRLDTILEKLAEKH